MNKNIVWFALRNLLLFVVLAVLVVAALRQGALAIDAHTDTQFVVGVLCYLSIPVVVVVYGWLVANDWIRLARRLKAASEISYEEQPQPKRLDHRR
jgi:TRAP-type C4-dicarboxylate transport system permease small subunit